MNDYEWIGFYWDRPVANHEQATLLLGVDSDELNQMVRRDNIMCVEKSPGKGKTREFTFQHLLHAAIVCEMRKYRMQLSPLNVQAAKEIADWVGETHGGKVKESLIGKVVYFVMSFDDRGVMRPIKPIYKDTIEVRNIGHSGVVIVLTSILSAMLAYLKPTTELEKRRTDKESLEKEVIAKIQPRRK